MGDVENVGKNSVENPEKKRNLVRPIDVRQVLWKPLDFLSGQIFFGMKFCVPEVCIALVADPDPAEHLRDVKSTGT
jgi:hypothetical protein